jgi:Ca2+:H+ antiporter
MLVNILWPVVPAAIAVNYARKDLHLIIFILNYIAMVPAANLVGFAGQEMARKLPKVFGVLSETTLGSVVEIVLFMVLLKKEAYPVIKAAILGSILATMLLCLGLCFFVGGLRRDEQVFDEVISEVGNGLLLTA